MKCPRLLISHTTTTIIFFKNLSGRYHLANIWPDHLIKRADLPSGQIHITIPKSPTNQLLVWFCWFSLFWPHYYYHLSRGGQRDGHTLPGDVIAANRTVVGAGKALVGNCVGLHMAHSASPFNLRSSIQRMPKETGENQPHQKCTTVLR